MESAHFFGILKRGMKNRHVLENEILQRYWQITTPFPNFVARKVITLCVLKHGKHFVTWKVRHNANLSCEISAKLKKNFDGVKLFMKKT